MGALTEASPRATGDGPGHGAAQPPGPGVWSGLGTVALYFLLQAGAAILIVIVVSAIVGFRSGFEGARTGTPADATQLVHATLQHPVVRTGITAGALALAALITALLIRRFWRAQWSRADLPGFGFVPPRSKAVYPGAIVLAVGVSLAGGALTHLLARGHAVQQDVTVLAGHASPDLRIVLAVLVVGVVPCIEELVFRGVLLSGLASRMRTGWAIALSALIFGAAHLPDFKFAWYPVPDLILLGAVAAWLRITSRSLWPAITLHATNNLLAVLMWFLVAPGPS